MVYKYYNNLIPQSICDSLVSYVEQCPTRTWDNKQVIGFKYLSNNKNISQILHLLNVLASRDTNNILFPEWVKIVIWPQGSFQNPHKDTARNSTKYTSITYLNNNYEGGETFFTLNNSMSKNNIGDTIMFDGKKYEHGVKPITKGTRYVLAVWYSDNINDYILNW